MTRQSTVLRTTAATNAPVLGTARALVRDAGAVRLAALGSSRHAAGYGAAVLDLLGAAPAVVLPAIGRDVAMPAWRPGDVLVAVSQSGATPALVAIAGEARAAGAAVIAVVNDDPAPLTEVAVVSLRCGAGREDAVAATASVTAQMLLLRLLAGDVPGIAVDELAAAVDECLALSPLLPVTAPSHVVASGFAAEWVADEAALKLAEMAGVLPSADSLVDHLHGPVAVVSPTLALLDATDRNAAALIGAPHVFSVGGYPGCDVATPRLADATLDAILRVVTAQVLALHWARRLQVDPDDARGLSKVTASW